MKIYYIDYFNKRGINPATITYILKTGSRLPPKNLNHMVKIHKG